MGLLPQIHSSTIPLARAVARLNRVSCRIALATFVVITSAPIRASTIDAFNDLEITRTACKLDNVSPCNGTTCSAAFPTALLTETGIRGVLGHTRITFIKLAANDASSDTVNVYLTLGLGFVYTTTAGAKGVLSFIYGAPTPLDEDFSDAGSLRLAFGNFGSNNIPVTIRVILFDNNLVPISSSVSGVLFVGGMASQTLELPLTGFPHDSGFDFKHVIFIQLDIDAGKGANFSLTEFGTVGAITPVLDPAIVPAASPWLSVMLAAMLVILGCRHSLATRG